MDVQAFLSLALTVIVMGGIGACVFDYALRAVVAHNDDLDSLRAWAARGNIEVPEVSAPVEAVEPEVSAPIVEAVEPVELSFVVEAEAAADEYDSYFGESAESSIEAVDYSSLTRAGLMKMVKELGLYRPGMSKYRKDQLQEVLLAAFS
jgi:hypothetical protein